MHAVTVLGQLRHTGRNHPVAALGGVLVAQRGLRCGVTEAAHQLGQRRAGLRGQYRAE